ncbi:MAG: hypothetical protein V4727_05675 [Verrucomicrobiota bacterium]
MTRLLKCSIALGASPLIIGTLVYFTWRLTRWQWLEMMGVMTVLIGFIVFLAGAVCLILHLKHESRARRTSPLNALLVGGLLIANFPLAAFYTSSAIEISKRYTVRVYNDSDHTIESFILEAPGVNTDLGPIPPKIHTKHQMHFTDEGSLKFTARQQELKFGDELEWYVSRSSKGRDKTIKVNGKGTYKIINNLH